MGIPYYKIDCLHHRDGVSEKDKESKSRCFGLIEYLLWLLMKIFKETLEKEYVIILVSLRSKSTMYDYRG